ncbi:type II-A CRISPR-associated protein Csn2 [Paucilactobacillus wasatchensis]|uniref:CRISPR-associated protein n=1 Tax=Paucilactobacillus wasatchensis TaxID=1335616 RepID=A0A0D1A5V2_9LACO|nr:type II-A CRISPR-associated protein Csn2 [Paucilactobacillus wasatchensis]KIS03032.1 CRISPR-associated protein [Paucilactobacillus wasatchensis]
MKLAYYPFEPFIFADDKITMIETGNHDIYQNLILNFKDLKEDLHFSDNDSNLLDTSKALHWFGDAFIQVDLDKSFQTHLYKKLKENMTESQTKQIFDLAQQLKTSILEATYILDLPLQVEEQTEMSKIFKFSDLHFSSTLVSNSYGIIEAILKTANELNDDKILGFMNVSDYLTDDELVELNELVRSLKLKVLLIKFSEIERREKFNGCRYYYIDSDYVEWK